jgi:hypothetical protein
MHATPRYGITTGHQCIPENNTVADNCWTNCTTFFDHSAPPGSTMADQACCSMPTHHTMPTRPYTTRCPPAHTPHDAHPPTHHTMPTRTPYDAHPPTLHTDPVTTPHIYVPAHARSISITHSPTPPQVLSLLSCLRIHPHVSAQLPCLPIASPRFQAPPPPPCPTHTHTHTRAHARTCARTRTHVRAHTHAHTHPLRQVASLEKWFSTASGNKEC